MKFETPVVEIQKFDVEDILTTSGSEEPTETEINPREGADPGYVGNCTGTMADYNMGTVYDCIG